MKRKLIATIMASAMALSALAGCGSSANSSAAESSASGGTVTSSASVASEEQVTIQFMHQQVEQERQEVVNKIISEFEQENPNIKVESMPTNEDDFDTKVTTLAGSGSLPAVMEFSQDQAKTSASNELLDFNAIQQVIDEKGEAAFYDGALSALKTEDGENYVGVPISGWVQGIWCNTAMLKEKGFDLPNSWDDVLKIAKAFNDPANKKYGIAIPTAEDTFTEQVFSQFAISNGANVFDGDGKVTLDTPEMKETAEYYKELASYSMPGSTGVSEIKDAFIGQNTPMCLYSTYILSAVKDAGFINDLELVLPNQKQKAAYGCIICFSIASNLSDAETEAAKKFVSFMLEKEHNEEWLLMAPGGVQPVLSEVADDKKYTENVTIKPFSHLLDSVGDAFQNLQFFGAVDGKNYMVMGDITNSSVLSKLINNIVVQGADTESELQNAQSQVENLVKERKG